MKILILGSGPERLGKMGELNGFVKEGLKFCRRKNINVVYVDSNPVAPFSAETGNGRVYIEPMTLPVLEKIIEIEKPAGILSAFGGQLALHLIILLDREGILDRHGVEVLGTPVSSIKSILDVDSFQKTLGDLSIPAARSRVVRSTDECLFESQSLRFPLALKSVFKLEGDGGYIVYNTEEIKKFAPSVLNSSPVKEAVLVEWSVEGIPVVMEFIRNPYSKHIVHAGSFEALESNLGRHPGDLPLFYPSVSVAEKLFERAVETAALISNKLNVFGTFQLQFSFCSQERQLYLEAFKHGLSRLSSICSIVKNIPMAEINAAIALKKDLENLNKYFLQIDEKNNCEGIEPAILRVPEFSSQIPETTYLKSTMCSTGSRIFAGRTPREAFAKSLNHEITKFDKTFNGNGNGYGENIDDLSENPLLRLLVANEITSGYGLSPRINPGYISMIDSFASVYKLLNEVRGATLSVELKERAESSGFCDESIRVLTRVKPAREVDKETEFNPVGPSPIGGQQGKINFFHHTPPDEEISDHVMSTVNESVNGGSVLVLGPGPVKIGWGSEIQYSMLRTAAAMKKSGCNLILLDDNPDNIYSNSEIFDAIFCEPITKGNIKKISDTLKINNILHQFCNCNLTDILDKEWKFNVIGTSLNSLLTLKNIDLLRLELKLMEVPVLDSEICCEMGETVKYAEKTGYPVMLNFLMTGADPYKMIVYDESDLIQCINDRIGYTKAGRILVEKYCEGMIGAELSGLADGKKGTVLGFFENIEEYGVHNDDCACITPALSVGEHQLNIATDILNKIVMKFGIVGFIRLELVIKGRDVFVAGISLFPGRNMPLIEKIYNKPVHSWLAYVLSGGGLEEIHQVPVQDLKHFFVRESVFSFLKFPELDPVLSPNISSTGQVMGHDKSFGKAFMKAQVAVNPKILRPGKVFLSGRDSDKNKLKQIAKKLIELGFNLVSTQGTAGFLIDSGIQVEKVHKVWEWRPNVIDLINNDEISLVINIPGGSKSRQDEKLIRRATIDRDIPLVTTISGALLMVRGIEEFKNNEFNLMPLCA